MNRPVLVVMAAGMGSRYGGLKQIDPMGEHGEILIDYSLYDAKRAGFEDVVFIIKRGMKEDFHSVIGDRIEKQFNVKYAYQETDSLLPKDADYPVERKKPWGTAHAILCCCDIVKAPFAVINADDYYGKHAFGQIFDALSSQQKTTGKYHWHMVGYVLKNTLTENGHVARGVCSVDKNHMLTSIRERTHIERLASGPAYTEDDGKTWHQLDEKCTVSMNLWGVTPEIFTVIEKGWQEFWKSEDSRNMLKDEYYLPAAVESALSEHVADVQVLQSPDRWYGVTYHEDKAVVAEAIRQMVRSGLYPEHLWPGE